VGDEDTTAHHAPDNADDDDDDEQDDDDGSAQVAATAAAANDTVIDEDMRKYGDEVATVLQLAKNNTFYQQGIMLMYCLIQKLRELGGELTSLVPLFHMAASYIMFDTRGIYHLLRNLAAKYPGLIECPETSENRFVQNRLEHLPAVLNLPPKLVQRPGEDVVGNRAYFRHSFSTDGIGVSLSTRQWKSRPNATKNPESDEKKAKRLTDAAAESVAPDKASTNYDREIVAIDPGHQAIITAIRMCDPNWTYSLSADEYYRMCGYDDDKAKDDKEISNMDG
ncbi:hypothetical protein H4S07_006817, partial [Coemansia furcata]